MKIRLLTLIVFLSSFSFGQQLQYTRTVSGNLFLPPGTPAANSKMRFQLKYCQGQNGRVPVNPGNPPGPTGIVVGFEPFDVNVSSDGSWKTQIYGNDQIMCGSDASGPSRWLIQPVFNGAASAGVEYQIQSCGPVLNCAAFSPDTAPGCGSANPTPPPPTITTDCAVGGGNPDLPDTTVTVNATMAVPNAINFSNLLLPPANGSVINFLLNGNQAGAYLPGNGNASTCLSGTGTWVLCGAGGSGGVTGATPNRGLVLTGTTLGLITCSTSQYLSWNGTAWVCTTLTGGGGGSFPNTAQYDLFASSGSGGAQASGVLGSNGFMRAQVYTATGDISGNRPAFQLFPNASVEYFPTGYANSQGTFGAANGLALYMSHSGGSSATANGGIALGGANSSGTGNEIYVDCEVAGCDFKVPVSYLGGNLGGGGGGGGLPTTPSWDLFASNNAGAAQASGVLGQAGFLRAYVLEATGTGTSSPWAVPNGSIEYFPTGGYGAGGANGVALHVSHSGSATGFGGIALAGGNSSGQDQLYLDCEGPPVVPALGCDFKVPNVTIMGAAIGGSGGGGVNPATVGQIASYNTATTVAGNAHLSDSGTQIISTEPIAAPSFVTTTPSTGVSMTGAGGNLPTPAPNIGGIGIGPGAIPMMSVNGGNWIAIPTTTGGTVTWGSIPTTPALSTQTDLQAALNSKVGTGSTLTPTTCAAGDAAGGILGNGNATGCFTPSGGPGTVSNPIVFPGAALTAPASGSGGFGVLTNGYPAVAYSGTSYKLAQQPSAVNGAQFGLVPDTNFVGTTASPCGGLTIPPNGKCINFIAGTVNSGQVAAVLVGDGSSGCLSGTGAYVTCGTGGAGGVTGATSGGGLVLSGTTLGMRTDCTANQYLNWNGSSWGCMPAPGGSGTVSGGTTGQFAVFNGATSVTGSANLNDTGVLINAAEPVTAPSFILPAAGELQGTGGSPVPNASTGAFAILTGGYPAFSQNGGLFNALKLSQVNGVSLSATDTAVNFNTTTPPLPANGVPVAFQASSASGTSQVSAAIVGDGNPAHCLLGTGSFATCPSATGGGALSGLTAASAANSIANSNFAQTWNWSLTGATAGMTFGEAAANTTAGCPGTYPATCPLAAINTLATSLSTPLTIIQAGVPGAATSVPALQLTSTYPTGAVGSVLGISVSNTGAASMTNNFFAFNAGANGNALVSKMDLTGNLYLAGALSGLTNSNNLRICGGPNALVACAPNVAATLGGVWLQGSDNGNNSINGRPGFALLRGGMLTSAPVSGQTEGLVQMGAGFSGTPGAQFNIVCGTNSPTFAVADCSAATQAPNVIGIATSVTNPVGVVIEGTVPVNLDSPAGAVGNVVCLSSTTDGKGHDNGVAPCTGGQGIGVIIATSGTVGGMFGSSTSVSQSLNTSTPLVLLHIPIRASSTGAAATTYSCTIAADASFTSTSAMTICSQALGASAKQWIVHCNLPFNFTTGTGTANVGINLTGGTPSFQTYITTVLGATAGLTYGSVSVTASGNTQMITRAISDATLYTLTLDGTIAAAANTTFSIYGTTTAGTAAFRPGVACVLQ